MGMPTLASENGQVAMMRDKYITPYLLYCTDELLACLYIHEALVQLKMADAA